jgi:transglutaminase-like putative cysteine protease
MGLILLFRRLVFAQVLLGIVAFCMAEQNAAMLLMAGALGALSWYVVEGPTGRPLPRWLTNGVGAMAAVAWLLIDLFVMQSGDPTQVSQRNIILAMGHFTMWLQVLMLYSRKSNRDYAMLLVLSLLQMIGASVVSEALLYAVLLGAYCLLALVTVLLFQLKATSDTVMELNQAAAPAGQTVARPKAVVTRGHRWQFRLTAAGLALSCTAVATAVFLFVPRQPASADQPELLQSSHRPEIGFQPIVTLGNPPPIPGSRDPVLSLQIRDAEGEPVAPVRPWLLRGAVLDHYDVQARQWSRGLGLRGDLTLDVPKEGVQLVPVDDGVEMYEAEVLIRRTNQRHLFATLPVCEVASANLPTVVFSPRDHQLAAPTTTARPVSYTFRTPVHHVPELTEMPESAITDAPVPPGVGPTRYTQRMIQHYARGWTRRHGQITRQAREVIARAGLSRDPEALTDPSDPRIAEALTAFLSQNYTYSLDPPPVGPNTDPLQAFLFEHKQGYCEMFASALAAMARSDGLRARVITGFRATERNRIGGYYVVRPVHAHAWVEIHCADQGWRTFDPSPAAAVDRLHRPDDGWLRLLGELYEHVEFAWAESVIAYDNRAQRQVLGGLRQRVQRSVDRPSQWFQDAWRAVADYVRQWRFDSLTIALLATIVCFILLGVGILIRTAVVHRRRLAALQLTRLPRARRRGLARRLRFYLIMLDALERHGHVRPAWQSPFLFAQQLADEDPMRFEPVVSLTEHFYEIRFGHRELTSQRRQVIHAHLDRLQANLRSRRSTPLPPPVAPSPG